MAKGQLSAGENHKTWLPYDWKTKDHESYILSNRLKELKDSEEIQFDFTKQNLKTHKVFP